MLLRLLGFRYIGAVSGVTRWTLDGKDAGNEVITWALWENAKGWRWVTKSGSDGKSRHSQEAKAKVKIWRRGGPLPPLSEEYAHRPKASLHVITGKR